MKILKTIGSIFALVAFVGMISCSRSEDPVVATGSSGISHMRALAISQTLTVDGATTQTGAFTAASTIAVTGVATLTGGTVYPSATAVIWTTGGPATSTTAPGADVACSDGDRYWSEVQVPYNVTLTGISYLVGSVGGTDSVFVDLYNSAGAVVATSDTVGAATIVGTAAQIQSVAFGSTYAAVAGKYYISLQFNGTTAKFRGYAVTGSKFIAASASGTFSTPAAITPGTTWTTSKGPVAALY